MVLFTFLPHVLQMTAEVNASKVHRYNDQN
jgi:hypothetical protein